MYALWGEVLMAAAIIENNQIYCPECGSEIVNSTNKPTNITNYGVTTDHEFLYYAIECEACGHEAEYMKTFDIDNERRVAYDGRPITTK